MASVEPDLGEAGAIVRALGLVPLVPEGGFFRKTWLDERSSAIYYLLELGDFSGLHRLGHLEIWAWHAGAPLSMLLIDADGLVTEPVMGPGIAGGERPQVVVPGGWRQAAEPLGAWTLVSTFMAPPYAEAIVEFGRREDLAGLHPAHADRIARLCRF